MHIIGTPDDENRVTSTEKAIRRDLVENVLE